MKKVTVLLVTLLGAGSLFAEGSSYSVTVDFPYVSKYVFRGVQNAQDSIQPSITVTSGNFSGGLWTNQPIINRSANEFRFYLNYDIPLNDSWKVVLGGTAYYYPDTPASSGPDITYEPKVSLVGSLGPVSSAFTYYYDTELKNSTGEATFGYSVPIQGGGKDTIDFGAAAGYVDLDAGGTYSYYSLSARANFRPKDNVTAYVGVQWSTNDLTGVGVPGIPGFSAIVGLTLSL